MTWNHWEHLWTEVTSSEMDIRVANTSVGHLESNIMVSALWSVDVHWLELGSVVLVNSLESPSDFLVLTVQHVSEWVVLMTRVQIGRAHV